MPNHGAAQAVFKIGAKWLQQFSNSSNRHWPIINATVWPWPISIAITGTQLSLAIMSVLQKKCSGNNLLNVGLFM
jgi:hypothetical protein